MLRVRGAPNITTRFQKGQVSWNAGQSFEKPCQQCGTLFHVEPWMEKRRIGAKFCSRACGYKGRVVRMTFRAGSEHPAWIDGSSRNGYPKEFSPSLKKRIRARDNHTCQLCGRTEGEHKRLTGRVLVVNHIDFNKQNCDESNLNTLCIGCNTKINWDRPRWTSYFQTMIQAVSIHG